MFKQSTFYLVDKNDIILAINPKLEELEKIQQYKLNDPFK